MFRSLLAVGTRGSMGAHRPAGHGGSMVRTAGAYAPEVVWLAAPVHQQCRVAGFSSTSTRMLEK